MGTRPGGSLAHCPAGSKLLSGGATVGNEGAEPSPAGALIESRPEFNGEESRWEWRANAVVIATGKGELTRDRLRLLRQIEAR